MMARSFSIAIIRTHIFVATNQLDRFSLLVYGIIYMSHKLELKMILYLDYQDAFIQRKWKF